MVVNIKIYSALNNSQKLRATSTILGGGSWRPTSTSPAASPSPTQPQLTEKDEMDPELAKYDNDFLLLFI